MVLANNFFWSFQLFPPIGRWQQTTRNKLRTTRPSKAITIVLHVTGKSAQLVLVTIVVCNADGRQSSKNLVLRLVVFFTCEQKTYKTYLKKHNQHLICHWMFGADLGSQYTCVFPVQIQFLLQWLWLKNQNNVLQAGEFGKGEVANRWATMERGASSRVTLLKMELSFGLSPSWL